MFAISMNCPRDDLYGKVLVSLKEMNGPLEIVIKTPRLKIVSINTNHFENQLIELFGNKTIDHLVGIRKVLDPELVSEKIYRWNQKWSDKNPISGYVILERKTKDFVGHLVLKSVKEISDEKIGYIKGMIEICYSSTVKHWGKNYGQEYTHAIVDHLIPTLIDSGYQVENEEITSVIATATAVNKNANSILQNFMIYTGTNGYYENRRNWYERKYV